MTLEAHACPNGHLTMPGHARCPTCQEPQTQTVDLSEQVATVVTWTTSSATPPGVRNPNHLAIVEFTVDGESVRTLTQLTTGDVETGDEVEPIPVDELRDPDAGIRVAESQRWDGYRFTPVESGTAQD